VWKLDFQTTRAGNEEDQGSAFLTQEPEVKKEKPDLDKAFIFGENERDNKNDATDDLNDDNSILKVTRVGSILRSGEGRLVSLVVDAQGRLLTCHSTDNTLELFLVCSEKEIQRRLARKAKKEKKRTGMEVDPGCLVPTVQEQFKRLKPVRASGKIKSICVRLAKKCSFRVLMALGNYL
jgi:hypothetical protein